MEAADLGARLCQSATFSVYSCFAVVAIPTIVLALASMEIAAWLPGLVLWWAKPWLDRTILFALSRAAFGQRTTPGDLWRAQREVWWSQLWLTVSLRRLSPWRSFTQPVYQLEGLTFGEARARIRQLRQRNIGSALMVTQVYMAAESALAFALMSLVFWFAPTGTTSPELTELLSGEIPGFLAVISPLSYALAILFIEPFYVSAGFAMYLNRRAQLEAWDIEQEFRRAFGR
jgi:hypothetical protein